MAVLKYLTGYPEPLVAQVSELLAQGKLGPWLQQRYPDPHEVRSDRQLYDYTQELKDRYLRKSVPLNKVCYDNTLEVIKHALGTHTAIPACTAAASRPAARSASPPCSARHQQRSCA